jgi:hypothetical protein
VAFLFAGGGRAWFDEASSGGNNPQTTERTKPVILKILAVVAAILVGSVVLVVAIGYALPQQHVAARAITLKQKPEDVFALISNFKDGVVWRAGLQQVEMLPERDEHIHFRERSKTGVITYEVVEANPPQRLVTRFDDKGLPFGGGWIVEVSPIADGCRLNITERGEIYNPVFRFVSRFILGYTGTMDTYLESVARRFGESAAPVDGNIAER